TLLQELHIGTREYSWIVGPFQGAITTQPICGYVLYFAWRTVQSDWQRIGELLDPSILSGEAAPPGSPNFTGAFAGMCCQDLAGTLCPADFDSFAYREGGYRAGVHL